MISTFSLPHFRGRFTGFGVLLAVLMALCPMVAALAEQVKLNTQIEVEEDYVTVSDIFDPVVHGAEHVVSRAPAPGETLVFKADALMRIAKSFHLDWRPKSGYVQVMVRRASTQISLDRVKEAIRQELISRYGIKSRKDTTWVVTLERVPGVFHVPSQLAPQIQFADVRFDRESSRFQTDIELYEGGGLSRLRGEFYAMIGIPVPLHSIPKDEIITARDLHIVHVRKDKVSPSVQTNFDKVVGKSSKRMLRPDAPIAMQYLQEPLLVKRQRLVSVIYSVKNLVLTTKGVAMSNGSMGQVVQVKNLKSKRIIDSVVTGSDEVSVSFAGERAWNS